MTLRVRLASLALVPTCALLVPYAWSYGTGAIPGFTGTAGTVPVDVNRAMPGCGQCHRSVPGGNRIDVSVALGARSLTAGQQISVSTTVTGGRPHVGNWGGFSSDVTGGTFSAGSNSRIDLGGTAITHTFAHASNNRRWDYGYTAPNTPGPIDMWVACNTVDGDGRNGPGDIWAFHGGDGLEMVSTPVRLFVNAAGVTPVGDACVGAWKNYPVLGTREPAVAGNANFRIELIGAAPLAPVVLMIGTPIAPLDLGLIGINGCWLLVSPAVSILGATGPGDPKFAEGTAAVALPLPAGLRANVRVQAAFSDALSGRPLPMTVTNALDLSIR